MTLQSKELQRLCSAALPVHVFLKNGIRLFGQIEEFDALVILLRNESIIQMVYQHNIATVLENMAVK